MVACPYGPPSHPRGDTFAFSSTLCQFNQAVFLNLLKNGVEALEGTGGTVRVRMRRGVGTVTIEVEDDGPGIDPALRDRLFEPFVTSKAAGRGTGLGLAISRRIVQEFGGSLELCSGSGRGSCFRVTLRAEGEDAG